MFDVNKTYRGKCVGYEYLIEVNHGGKKYLLKHYVKHSPTGFCWGYLGSGPSEAARCILIDLTGKKDIRMDIYMKFKKDYIAHFPREGEWLLHGWDILSWLKHNDFLDLVYVPK